MKKIMALLLSLTLFFALGACGNNAENQANGETDLPPSESMAADETENTETEESGENTENVGNSAESRVLIVYYSYSGITRGVSERLQEMQEGGERL